MREKLSARIHRLLRPSQYIPEGADVGGQRWDLPHGGSGRVLDADLARRRPSTRDREDEVEAERDWQELLSWAAASPPAPTPSTPREVVTADDEDAREWAAALARVRAASPGGDERPPAKLQEVPPPPVSAPLPASSPVAMVPPPAVPADAEDGGDEEWEWALSLARVKAANADNEGRDEEDEWEWARSLARAKVSLPAVSIRAIRQAPVAASSRAR
ncbi:MAG TPA: hypothetical protein VGG33_28250 [Polyangia bacterium]